MVDTKDVEVLHEDFVEYHPSWGTEPIKINRKKARVNVDGVELYFELHSAGESDKTVLLVHGLSSINKTWDELLRNELAAAGYTVVIPDLPNHGKSGSMDQKGLTIYDYPEKLHNKMEKLGIKDWVTASSSGSAPFIMAMAEKYPDKVKGVFSSAPVCKVREIPGLKYLGYHITKNFLCLIDFFCRDKFNIMEKIKNYQAKHRSQTEAEKRLYLHSAKYDASRGKNPTYKLTNKALIRTIKGWHKYKPKVPEEVPFAIQFSEKDTIAKVKKFTLVKNAILRKLSRYGLAKPPKEKTVLDLLEKQIEKYTGIHGGSRPHVYLVTGEVGHHIQKEAPIAFADNIRHFMEQIGYLPEQYNAKNKGVRELEGLYLREHLEDEVGRVARRTRHEEYKAMVS